jgi:hypothetical protein
LYSGTKSVFPLSVFPGGTSGTSPGSWEKAKMGIDGTFDAMDELAGKEDNRRWRNSCEHKK